MKIAHLILAHNNPEQLNRLVKKLQHPDADIYIHLDLKTDIAAFGSVFANNNTFVVNGRVKVYWGSYSIVQATLNGFKEILRAKKGYDYINILSTNDYPIKSADTIHQYFCRHPDKIFIEYFDEQSDWWKKIKTRVTKYHLTDYNFPGQYKIQNILNAFFPDRKPPAGLVFVGFSQWMTITEEAARYVLQYLINTPKVYKFFRLSWGADEVVIHTILYNSHLKDKMVNDNLRYIDWSEGKDSPKTLTIADKDAILASPKLYARKFDMAKEPGVLDFLDSRF